MTLIKGKITQRNRKDTQQGVLSEQDGRLEEMGWESADQFFQGPCLVAEAPAEFLPAYQLETLSRIWIYQWLHWYRSKPTLLDGISLPGAKE